MKRSLAYLILAQLLTTAVQAQSVGVIPDSLDWHRYFPLHVGDVWEYRVTEGEPLLVHSIVGDSLTLDHRYFLMETRTWDFDYVNGGDELQVWGVDTLFVRYSSDGGIFRFYDLSADTLSSPRNMPFWGGTTGYYDLRTAFGDSVFYSTGPDDFYWTTGGYQESIEIGGVTYSPDAVKRFSGGFMWETYAADIGLISSMNLWGPTLTYARIEGTEYGESRIPTHVERDSLPDEFVIESIFPNPASKYVTVLYRTPSLQATFIQVFDLLGRMVWSDEIFMSPAGVNARQIPVLNWTSGVYFIRLFSNSGSQIVKPVTLIR